MDEFIRLCRKEPKKSLAIFITCVVFLLAFLFKGPPEQIIVQTQNGAVRGLREHSLRNGMSFYAFRGIPYAKPPTGRLRLKVNAIFSGFVIV